MKNDEQKHNASGAHLFSIGLGVLTTERWTMKAYCTNCKQTQPASFRKGEFEKKNALGEYGEYEDLCCDECHMILATVEERDVGVGERLEAIFYQDENGTRWVYSNEAYASIGAPDSIDNELGKAILYVPYA